MFLCKNSRIGTSDVKVFLLTEVIADLIGNDELLLKYRLFNKNTAFPVYLKSNKEVFLGHFWGFEIK